VVKDGQGSEQAALQERLSVLGAVVTVTSPSVSHLSRLREIHSGHREAVKDQCRPGESAALVQSSGPAISGRLPDPGPRGVGEPLLAKALAGRNRELLLSLLESLVREWDEAKLPQNQVRQRLTVMTARVSPAFDPLDIEGLMASSQGPGDLAAAWSGLLWASVQEKPVAPDGEHEQMVLAAKTYMESHFTQEITGEQLSKLTGIVPSYLSKLFREAVGQSPVEYVTSLRIQQAKKLLESDSPVMVKDVAQAVGYTDQAYFSRVFKRLVGTWPSEYQASQRAK